MTTVDKSAFARLMVTLNVHYDKKASALKADIYWRGLQPVPIDLLESAVERWVERSNRYPRISDLRAMCDAVTDARMVGERRLTGRPVSSGPDEEYGCRACEDTGWRYHAERDGVPFPTVLDAVQSGARYVSPCPCRSSNEGYRRKHQTTPKRYGTDTDSRGTDRYMGNFAYERSV